MRVSRPGNVKIAPAKISSKSQAPPETVETMFRRLSKTDSIVREHIAYLESLRQGGFSPSVIYDIGAGTLNWTKMAQKVWPSAKVYVFEAVSKLEFLYRDAGLPYHIGLMSDQDGREVKFYENERRPFGNSYYRENSRLYPASTFSLVSTQTVDTIALQKDWPSPDLIHIDANGAEKDILIGATRTLLNTKYILVNLQSGNHNEGAPKVETMVPWIESKNFSVTSSNVSGGSPSVYYCFKQKQAPVSILKSAPSKSAGSSSRADEEDQFQSLLEDSQ